MGKIYDKDKREGVKVIISYKASMDSIKFLLNTRDPKIGHIWDG